MKSGDGSAGPANRVPSFWDRMEQLIASSEVVVERARGTPHPRFPEMIYPLDYGYLAGTSSGDGNDLDLWVGSRAKRDLDAIVCTVDLAKSDAEVKLLLGCTEEEKE